ncbi:MAG TPA: peptide chain release factor-like protein [Candidatus Goldiibacteriota bacterium]|nr:peptide chain release factor-like protein [Candidatus Goldiibacteriota bacterium]
MVSHEKRAALEKKLERLGIKRPDIREKFMPSGCKGGQKANKTSNAVYLKHLPTGIEVKCRQSRERELNRFLARRILADRVEELLTGASDRTREAERIRKQKDRNRRRRPEVLPQHETEEK